jgi:hypothetical protein
MHDEYSNNYDVFLSHHSADKAVVEEIAMHLREEGLSVFLDSDSLEPGEAWMAALEAALQASCAFMICVGPSGIGPWTEQELHVALDRAARESAFAVIPVLLPGASRSQQDEVSLFLRQYQFLDFRRGISGEGIDRALEALQRAQGGEAKRRRIPGAPTPAMVEPVLERLQSRFSESVRHHLAGGHLIQRKETRELIARLDEETTRVVVVHGIAGSGKSGVLFELVQELAEQGVPFLPLRLDRYELRGDPQRFGSEALGLPSSPAKALAAISTAKVGVLILDQLDALRWTAAHSSEAWDVCREIITEALGSTAGLKVVVCCRTFDLEHDPQLRGWEQEIKNLRRIEVQQLSPEDVTAAVRRAAEGRGGVPTLRPKEEELLRHIHHLQMWLAIYMSTESPPVFDTAWSLMEQFWANRLDELAKGGMSRERAEELERRFVKALEEGAILAAPVRKLGMAQSELDLYQRLHVLDVNASRGTFTFCHQSYQDYLVAKHLLAELDQCTSEEGSRKIVAWLGSKEKQSLFRREQLRLLLGALRAEEHEVYLPTLRELLPSLQPDADSQLRFHLRLLSLQLLGQLSDPRPEEISLVLTLLDEPFWREHVLAEVVRGQVPWFNVLDEHGKLEAWLASEEGLRDKVLELLLYMVEKCGDQVARLLGPYVEKDEVWTRRIIWVLRFDPSQDSDALFDLRLRLTKDGSYTPDHVEWDKLALSHPERFVLLICYVLIAFAISIGRGEDRLRPGRRSEIDWHGLEKVGSSVIPRQLWATAWSTLFRAVSLVAGVRKYESEAAHALESYALDFETMRPILRLLKRLASTLLGESWLELVSLGAEFSQGDRRAEVLFLDSLVEGPASPELADWALGWLMADPWRARLRVRRNSGRWSLPSQLIERYAPVSSPETYSRLEDWLLDYREPDLLNSYQRRHEWIGERGELKYPSSFGETPHHLLPKLPVERRSVKVESRIKELKRKFPPRTSLEEEENGRSGWVGSPLSEDAKARMTDEDWLSIATNERLPARSGKWKFRGDRIEEASIETFATELRSMTQLQPERFGKLALRLPGTANPAFLKAIVAGLAWPGDRNDQTANEWAPPSHEILEEVLAISVIQDLTSSEAGVAMDFCRILDRYSKYTWSERAVERLVWVAQHHENPKLGYYPIGSSDRDSEHFDGLETNALNVTRGQAGFAVRSLLFAQPLLFASLRPALESLIGDDHPAVRVAAFAACLPVINIDRDLAVDLFLQCCDGPDAILGSHWASDFLRYTYRTHLHRLRLLIERMVECPLHRVSTAGAVQVAACFLVEGQLEKEFERCLGGSPPQRKGIAKVAASLLGEGEFADKAKATLLRLAEDEDKQVAQIVAHSFDQLDLRHITADRGAWNAFARSKAFQTDPSPLLRALDHQTGDLLPFADCLLTVGVTFAEELAEASQNMATGISGDARQLLPLLLRLYEQARDRDKAIYLCCLDLWDRLLERRVGAAMGLTRELDRV